MEDIQKYLTELARSHKNLCPRQVLGVRMGRYAARLLGFEPLEVEKRLLVVVESDGCFATGVCVATGCSIGHRNLRVEDYGKAAATFTDTELRRSVRISPRANVRTLALQYAQQPGATPPSAEARWQAMLQAYQRIPDELLFSWQSVELRTPIEAILSSPGIRTACEECGEEIINERELTQQGRVLCRSCAGFSYYAKTLEPAAPGEGSPTPAPGGKGSG